MKDLINASNINVDHVKIVFWMFLLMKTEKNVIQI
jgi:hypothetical protein